MKLVETGLMIHVAQLVQVYGHFVHPGRIVSNVLERFLKAVKALLSMNGKKKCTECMDGEKVNKCGFEFDAGWPSFLTIRIAIHNSFVPHIKDQMSPPTRCWKFTQWQYRGRLSVEVIFAKAVLISNLNC